MPFAAGVHDVKEIARSVNTLVCVGARGRQRSRVGTNCGVPDIVQGEGGIGGGGVEGSRAGEQRDVDGDGEQ